MVPRAGVTGRSPSERDWVSGRARRAIMEGGSVWTGVSISVGVGGEDSMIVSFESRDVRETDCRAMRGVGEAGGVGEVSF